LQKTPKEHIYTRPAKGGGEWEYVTGVYVKKVLNYCFGWRWDFEIKEHGREGNLVWVLGRLTIKNQKNEPIIVKEQFGRADIKFKKGTKTPLDYGNDLKAAATDAEIQQEDKGYVPPKDEIIGEVEEEKPRPKLEELKGMLKGKTDKEKIEDLRKRTGIKLKSFDITEKHATILLATLLNKK